MILSHKLISLLLLLIFPTLNVSNSTNILCFQTERKALLSFKQDLQDPHGILSSWVAGEEDCCKWYGIVCDHSTGHVQELHLAADPYKVDSPRLQGKINPSLLDLKQLSHLNLSYNAFEGVIPHQLGNLSSLRHLDLGYMRTSQVYPYDSKLYVENLHWLSSLSSLEYLDMSWVNLSKASDHWLHAINKLPSLLELHLSACELQGKINPSLLDLKQLSHLDLSHNHFEGTQIPSFIGSLVSLRYLNLKGAGFEGVIPHQLGNLSSLRHLDLGWTYLYVENLHWLSSLSSLEYLDMTYVNLSKASDHWLHAINKLPSLLELHLIDCSLGHIHPLSYTNFTSLSVLDISENNFNSFIPDWVFSLSSLVELYLSSSQFIGSFPNGSFSLTSLTSLDVSGNSLSCTIPSYFYGFSNLKYLSLGGNKLQGVVSISIRNLTSLVTLDLWGNALVGELPASMGDLCNLQSIVLSDNLLSGPIPVSLGNLSSLVYLQLSDNKLNGSLPESLGSLSNLQSLDISNNKLNGSLPESLGSLSNLQSLYISNNKLNGSLPESLGSLSNLQSLYISNNLFQGVVSEVHFANLTNLLHLMASENSLSLRVNPHWIPPFDLYSLELGSWNLGSPQFPTWLKSQKRIREIDLSNTGISEAIPRWFSNNSQGLSILRLGGNLLSGNIPDCWMYYPSLIVIDLSNNNLTGTIPNSMGSLDWLFSLHLRNNSLSGEIPSSLQNCTGLGILDLGLNRFDGSIPNWIGISLPNLMILIIRSNKLNDHIPVELCRLRSLQIFDAANNNLSGTIPRCFNNFSQMAIKNELIGSMSTYFLVKTDPTSGIPLLDSAILVTKGREDKYDKILRLFTSLDLSNNYLSGGIPKQLTSLQWLRSLNLSGNHLRGSIPDQIGNMTWLETLDLSRNNLSRNIPPSISSMTFLSHLNLSYNNLSGEIPLGTQLQTSDNSSFIGNQLCGPPLTKNCHGKNNTIHKGTEHGEGVNDEEEYWFRLGIAMGFVVGFLGIIAPLLACKIWRHAYYWFWQDYMLFKIVGWSINFKNMLRT